MTPEEQAAKLAEETNAWVLAHALLAKVERCPAVVSDILYHGARVQMKNAMAQLFKAGSLWLIGEMMKATDGPEWERSETRAKQP